MDEESLKGFTGERQGNDFLVNLIDSPGGWGGWRGLSSIAAGLSTSASMLAAVLDNSTVSLAATVLPALPHPALWQATSTSLLR